jgi:hypothetical protein
MIAVGYANVGHRHGPVVRLKEPPFLHDICGPHLHFATSVLRLIIAAFVNTQLIYQLQLHSLYERVSAPSVSVCCLIEASDFLN